VAVAQRSSNCVFNDVDINTRDTERILRTFRALYHDAMRREALQLYTAACTTLQQLPEIITTYNTTFCATPKPLLEVRKSARCCLQFFFLCYATGNFSQ
jgi:hypothetical protein